MPDLTYRQAKIQEKRKQTSFRDFVMEVCSWYTLNLYKYDGMITRYPDTNRKWKVVKSRFASMNNEHIWDWTGDFFQNFQHLYTISEKSALITLWDNENSAYSDNCYGAKNAYLSFNIGENVENILYTVCCGIHCYNIFNALSITYNSANIFESKNIRNSLHIFYSANINNSSECYFCSNLISCHHCINCDNLTNQSYCIDNKQLSREQYEIIKTDIWKDKKQFTAKKLEAFSRIGNVASTDVNQGRGVLNSHIIQNAYLVANIHNARNVVLVEGGDKGSFEMYDCIDCGIDVNNYYGACQLGIHSEQMYCIVYGGGASSHCFYSMNLDTCSFCLGCIGLKNASYCIFNKQYTKEERHEKVDEIFTQMEKDGTLGQFFPATMNPFYFNDTAAYLIDPTFTQEEVEKAGYLRRSTPIKVDIPANADLVKVSELDQYETFDLNGTRTINPAILQKVIQDDAGNARRIVKMEYDFLVKYALPLPRKHRLERMKENFKIG